MAIGEVIRRAHQDQYRIGLSTDTKPTTGVKEGAEFYEQDTGDTYVYLLGSWVLKSDPTTPVKNRVYDPDTLSWVAEPLVRTVNVAGVERKYKTVMYEDGEVMYFCKALPGTALAAAAWQIVKVDFTSGMVETSADGDFLFDNVATNLASVQAQSFS